MAFQPDKGPAFTPGPSAYSKKIILTHSFEIPKPEPKKILKKGRTPKPKQEKPRGAQKTLQERLETQREYERARRQSAECKAYQRETQKQLRIKGLALGLCRDCGKPSIEGQTRCEVCRDKHRPSCRRPTAERRAQRLELSN